VKGLCPRLDTKYKEIGENENPPSEHVMQMFSYSSSTKAKKCVLIYADTKSIEGNKYSLMGDISLHILHFNLTCQSKKELDLNCSNFVNQIMNIYRRVEPSNKNIC
jgi:5-methylcytosine-specific restriction endonuclease McrBC regulatory subunit McrC